MVAVDRKRFTSSGHIGVEAAHAAAAYTGHVFHAAGVNSGRVAITGGAFGAQAFELSTVTCRPAGAFRALKEFFQRGFFILAQAR